MYYIFFFAFLLLFVMQLTEPMQPRMPYHISTILTYFAYFPYPLFFCAVHDFLILMLLFILGFQRDVAKRTCGCLHGTYLAHICRWSAATNSLSIFLFEDGLCIQDGNWNFHFVSLAACAWDIIIIIIPWVLSCCQELLWHREVNSS